jgi:hypothetical protein
MLLAGGCIVISIPPEVRVLRRRMHQQKKASKESALCFVPHAEACDYRSPMPTSAGHQKQRERSKSSNLMHHATDFINFSNTHAQTVRAPAIREE